MSKDIKSSKNNQVIPGELTKDDEIKLKSVLDTLEKDPMSYEFLNPVDTIGLGLSDYFDYVKYPMDLGTVNKKLKNNKYVYVQDAIDDIFRIWTNCKIYNMEGSDIYRMAESLEKISKKLLEKHYKLNKIPTFNKKQALSEIDVNKKVVSEKEMIEFTEYFRLADESTINIVIENLRQFSPMSLVFNNKDLSIKVNLITRTSYDQIIQLLRPE